MLSQMLAHRIGKTFPHLLRDKWGETYSSFNDVQIFECLNLYTDREWCPSIVLEFNEYIKTLWDQQNEAVKYKFNEYASVFEFKDGCTLFKYLSIAKHTRFYSQSSRNWLVAHREDIRYILSDFMSEDLGACFRFKLQFPTNWMMYCEPVNTNKTQNIYTSRFYSILEEIMLAIKAESKDVVYGKEEGKAPWVSIPGWGAWYGMLLNKIREEDNSYSSELDGLTTRPTFKYLVKKIEKLIPSLSKEKAIEILTLFEERLRKDPIHGDIPLPKWEKFIKPRRDYFFERFTYLYKYIS